MIDFNPNKKEIPEKGKVLISEPFLEDPYFKRTVVLLCDHDDSKGTFGLVLNKSLEISLDDIMESFPGFDGELSMGGPVEQNSLFFLHNKPELIDDGQKVMEDVYLGGNFEKVVELLKLGLITHHEIRFFLGYAGWAEMQLQSELNENAWIVAAIQPSLVMKNPEPELWKEVLNGLGNKFALLTQFPEDPTLN